MKAISQEEHESRLALYREGLTDKEIAQKRNVHHMTILNWRKKHDLAAQNRKLKLVPCAEGKPPKGYEDMVWLEPGEFLDKHFPGWRKSVHLWPPRADGMPRNYE